MKTDTSIPGLTWAGNYCAETGPKSYTIVANPGPLVTDFHLWLRDAYEAYILHIGQEDRFTFIGELTQEVSARFVDCRRDSPSLHEEAVMSFTPDPRKVLHIPPGVAMYFEGLRNVTVRSEPVWFAPSGVTPYQVGNDQIRIPVGTSAGDFPTVSVNDLPLPREVLQIICKRQQEMLRSGARYDTTFGVPVGDEIHRLLVSRSDG